MAEKNLLYNSNALPDHLATRWCIIGVGLSIGFMRWRCKNIYVLVVFHSSVCVQLCYLLIGFLLYSHIKHAMFVVDGKGKGHSMLGSRRGLWYIILKLQNCSSLVIGRDKFFIDLEPMIDR